MVILSLFDPAGWEALVDSVQCPVGGLQVTTQSYRFVSGIFAFNIWISGARSVRLRVGAAYAPVNFDLQIRVVIHIRAGIIDAERGGSAKFPGAETQ